MRDSKRARGIVTPKRAVQRALRKVNDLSGVVLRDEPGPKPTERKQLVGRAASRALKHGRGYEKPWRSRMQRTRRKQRTGGVK